MLATVRDQDRHSLVRLERPLRRLSVLHEPMAGAWRSLIEQTAASPLQSAEWAAVKCDSGWAAYRLVVSEDDQLAAGAQILFRSTPLGVLAYVPRGPSVDFDDAQLCDRLMAAVVRVARQQGAIAVRLEPNTRGGAGVDAFARRWSLSPASSVQPRSTLILDLDLGPTVLWDQLSSRTRYNIRLATRRGVHVLEGEESDVPRFHSLLLETGRRAGFAVHSLEYFQSVWKHFGRQGLARLLFARRDGEILSAALDLTMGRKTYHLYAASCDSGREHKPNDLLQWEAIRRAQADGSTEYDMWGIPDEVGQADEEGWPEPTTGTGGLWGVYSFKRGFGGTIVRYAGAYDLALVPARHWLWRQAVDRWRWLKTSVNTAAATTRSLADH